MQEKPTTDNLRVALYLMEMGIAMQRQRLRREDPSVSEQTIDDRLDAWLKEPSQPMGLGHGES